MSRRGNWHDNTVAESFFQLLKRERINRRIYPIRDEARTNEHVIMLEYRARRAVDGVVTRSSRKKDPVTRLKLQNQKRPLKGRSRVNN